MCYTLLLMSTVLIVFSIYLFKKLYKNIMFIKQVRLINNLITKEVDDVKWKFDINNKCIGYNLLSDNDIVQRVEYNPDFDMFTLTEKGTVTKIIVHANRNEDKINLIKRIIKYKRSKLNPAIKKV